MYFLAALKLKKKKEINLFSYRVYLAIHKLSTDLAHI